MITEFEQSTNWKLIEALNKISSWWHSFGYGTKKFFGLFGIVIIGVLLFPLIVIFVLSSTLLYKKMARDLSSLKPELINSIATFSFEKIIDEEQKILELKETLEKLIKDSEEDKDSFMLRGYYRSSHSILRDLTEIDVALKSYYKLSSSDFFDNEDDFIIYQKELTKFNDVWDYESTNEEKNIAFDIKKKSSNS